MHANQIADNADNDDDNGDSVLVKIRSNVVLQKRPTKCKL